MSLGHPSKFQRVSPLGFVTAPTPLKQRAVFSSPNFTIYRDFRDFISSNQQRAPPVFITTRVTLSRIRCRGTLHSDVAAWTDDGNLFHDREAATDDVARLRTVLSRRRAKMTTSPQRQPQCSQHWRRQLWGSGARAPRLLTIYFFS